jgi:hypothetical protein
MLQVEWIQSDHVVLHRDIDGTEFNQLSLNIEEAVRDLIVAIVFNEDLRSSDLQLHEPLHLRIASSSSNYYSHAHTSDLRQHAFSPGGTADSFASFLTSHLYHASVLEYDLGLHYWPMQIFLDNCVSPERDICISIDSDQQYTAMSFGVTWVENKQGASVLLTNGGFKTDDDFRGLIPSNDLINALEHPLKYMRAFTTSKSKCSVCNNSMPKMQTAYCENCRLMHCLPAEMAYQQYLLDIKSLRASKLSCKRYLSSQLEQHYYINEQGRLEMDNKDVPF